VVHDVGGLNISGMRTNGSRPGLENKTRRAVYGTMGQGGKGQPPPERHATSAFKKYLETPNSIGKKIEKKEKKDHQPTRPKKEHTPLCPTACAVVICSCTCSGMLSSALTSPRCGARLMLYVGSIVALFAPRHQGLRGVSLFSRCGNHYPLADLHPMGYWYSKQLRRSNPSLTTLNDFPQSMTHGVLVELLEGLHDAETIWHKAISFCAEPANVRWQFSCLHGVGHGVFIEFTKSTEVLSAADTCLYPKYHSFSRSLLEGPFSRSAEICSSKHAGSREFQYYCWSGASMSFFGLQFWTDILDYLTSPAHCPCSRTPFTSARNLPFGAACFQYLFQVIGAKEVKLALSNEYCWRGDAAVRADHSIACVYGLGFAASNPDDVARGSMNSWCTRLLANRLTAEAWLACIQGASNRNGNAMTLARLGSAARDARCAFSDSVPAQIDSEVGLEGVRLCLQGWNEYHQSVYPLYPPADERNPA
jgi:hypothetical protein